MKTIYCFLFFGIVKCFGQFTAIPDQHFELALVGFGYDDIVDGYVLTDNIDSITSLTIIGSEITSLEGIQDFHSLRFLDCHNNNIMELDLSGLIYIEEVDCKYNHLTELIVSDLPNLKYLNCSSNWLQNLSLYNLPQMNYLLASTNFIQSLDLTGIPSVHIINVAVNNMQNLNLSGLVNLEILWCYINNIRYLDISSLINLKTCICSSNSLENILIDGLFSLSNLDCNFNSLLSLDVSNCPNLRSLSIYSNPDLNCVKVDDVDFALTFWILNKDSHTQLSEDCEIGQTSIINNQCGITLQSVNTVIYANNVLGAQSYRFKIVDISTNTIYIKENQLRTLNLSDLPIFKYSNAYSIQVAVKLNNSWKGYGSVCTIYTNTPLPKLEVNYCNAHLSNNSGIIFSELVPKALGYKFRIENLLTNEVQYITRILRSLPLSLLNGISNGGNYRINVAIKNTDGQYLEYGEACNIFFQDNKVSTKSDYSSFSITCFPNPFNDTFTLITESESQAPYSLLITDVSGRIVNQSLHEGFNNLELNIGKDLTKGIYILQLRQNNNLKTCKIIKS